MEKDKSNCVAVLDIITRGVSGPKLTLVKANYTIHGLTAVIKDEYNDQHYELTLKPIKGGVDE
jgi:hypothetical protein